MRWKTGNIMVYYDIGKTVVITTNAGWKSNGDNVMGKGLAKEIANRLPDLPKIYGKACMALIPHQYYPAMRVILVPTKPLVVENPSLSWKQDASIHTVRKSLEWLQNNVHTFKAQNLNEVYVPLLGTKNGRLDPLEVEALMDRILKDDIFVGVKF